MRTNYVLGFAFDAQKQRVLLIEKQRPAWQKGKLNGIGGHIEESDRSPGVALVREFAEETGISTTTEDWTRFLEMGGEDWFCTCCFTVLDNEKFWSYKSLTDEHVQSYIIGIFSLNPFLDQDVKVLPNLRWIVPLALDAIEQGIDTITSYPSAKFREEILRAKRP